MNHRERKEKEMSLEIYNEYERAFKDDGFRKEMEITVVEMKKFLAAFWIEEHGMSKEVLKLGFQTGRRKSK